MYNSIKQTIKKYFLPIIIAGSMFCPLKSNAKQSYDPISERNYNIIENAWNEANNKFENTLDEIVSDSKMSKDEAIRIDNEISKIIYAGEGWGVNRPLNQLCFHLSLEHRQRLCRDVITPSTLYKIKDFSQSELENFLTRRYKRKIRVEYSPSDYTTLLEFSTSKKGFSIIGGSMFLGLVGLLFGIPYLINHFPKKRN